MKMSGFGAPGGGARAYKPTPYVLALTDPEPTIDHRQA
jgi:hypothetical protein